MHPTASQTVIAVQRSLVAQRRAVVPGVIDSLVEGGVRMRKERAFAIAVPWEYVSCSDDRATGAAWEPGAQDPGAREPEARTVADARSTRSVRSPVRRRIVHLVVCLGVPPPGQVGKLDAARPET